MLRDMFGSIIRSDLWTGKKRSKKEIKREILAENRSRGKTAEDIYRMNAVLRGKELERSPRGRDFIERTRDPWTGRVTRTVHAEIKSSSAAPLSKLQKRTKKNKSNYKVVRMDSGFF